MKKNITLISLMLGVVLLVSLGAVSAGTISFLDEDSFSGVDDTTGFTNDNSWNALGTGHLNLLGGSGDAYAYDGGQSSEFSQRGTRGLGIVGNEGDEVDSIDSVERIDIEFDSAKYITYIEVRSLFDPEGDNAPEQGEVEFYINNVLQDSDNMIGSEPDNGGNDGDWSETYSVLADKIVFYVDSQEDYSDWSEFAVSRIEFEEPECQLIISNPEEGEFFDSEVVPINWTLSESCKPVNYFDIQYQKGDQCDDQGNWHTIVKDLDSGDAANPIFPDYSYIWDKPSESGQYCVTVKVTSATQTNYSEVFNVDHAPPEIDIDEIVGGYEGDCSDGPGECYVNNESKIKLTCSDTNPSAPWQSGVGDKEYRYQVNGGNWTNWIDYPYGGFSFPEDSNHTLEYRCFDNVDKVDNETKTFIVDSQAPIFNPKVVGQPNVTGCDAEQHPGNQEVCDYYVNQSTMFQITAYDPQPHPVGDVNVSCTATVWETLNSEGQNVEISLDENGWFSYGEDSYHELHCVATDALGNSADYYEADIVDSVAPGTNLTYEGPYYDGSEKICTKWRPWGCKEWETVYNGGQWIDGVSKVVLEGVDPQPHPVNDVVTYYRYDIVADEFCYGTNEQGFEGLNGEWITYNEPFNMSKSCHAIEYYSADALGNTEDIQTEFVFVDKTAPETVKEVGEPASKCGLFNNCNDPEWDWYDHTDLEIDYEVTMDTPITISCNDVNPHPSGVGENDYSGIYWRIVWDGKYNDSSAMWKHANTDKAVVKFKEQSEHLLEFYCVDNVNKTSETHSELFKVIGEDFTLKIGDKWDLISVPFNLIGDGYIGEVLNDSRILEVWSYEGGVWKVYYPNNANESTLTKLVPGRGYWVKTTDDLEIKIGGALIEQGPVLPPSVDMEPGWNLIGHYGLYDEEAYCSLFSLVDTQEGFPRWSALYGYYAPTQSFYGLPNYWSDETKPGRGYWLEVDVEESYNPATICYGNLA